MNEPTNYAIDRDGNIVLIAMLPNGELTTKIVTGSSNSWSPYG